MPIYEKRTYDIAIGEMGNVIKAYKTKGWPALEAGGFAEHLVGYFISDTGDLHQLIHIWRFDDDAHRRQFWKDLFSNEAFLAFAPDIRPHITKQNVQLLSPAPWGQNP